MQRAAHSLLASRLAQLTLSSLPTFARALPSVVRFYGDRPYGGDRSFAPRGPVKCYK